jgi:hypothetical protein
MILVTGIVTAKPETIDEMVRVSTEHVHRSRTAHLRGERDQALAGFHRSKRDRGGRFLASSVTTGLLHAIKTRLLPRSGAAHAH